MFMRLEEIAFNQENYYGNTATWLRILAEKEIKTLKTIVVTQDLFQLYILSNNFDKTILKNLYTFIVNEFGNIPEFFLKVSLFKENIGVSSNLIVKNSLDEFEQNIERVYHSWSDNFAHAHRITYHIDEKDTYPTLLIQPYEENVFSLVTRCPQKGLPTDQSNLVNVHNYVEGFEKAHITMLEITEAVLGFPAKIYFTKDIRICYIKPELMCDYAYFVSLNDLLRKKYIDELHYLSNIKPHFISKVTNVNYSPVRNSAEYIQLRGVPSSPGRAMGTLTFNSEGSFKKNDSESRVCCFASFHPDDVQYLVESAAAFSNEGGATSHLAVVSRAFQIPSIVGISSLVIDFERKQVQSGSKSFNEGCSIMIDGYTGIITISSKPFNVEPKLTHSAILDNENLQQLYLLLKKYTGDFNSFRELPVDLQLHMSALTQRFKTIGFTTG